MEEQSPDQVSYPQSPADALLADLNRPQRQAVTTTEGPLLILAGAGSGKTKTLIHRIAYLYQVQRCPTSRILAVTFTNKAAGELRERLTQLVRATGQRVYFPWVGTFHSLCVRLLRQDIVSLGWERNFGIYDEADSLALVKQVMNSLHLDQKQTNPRAIRSFISGAKNELLSPAEYAVHADGQFMETVAQVYERYQAELAKAQALDFDDIIITTVELLNDHEPVRHRWSEQFQYLMIDEYQDTNKPQYELTRLLARNHHNLCVVGDDYQAIYGWRGANYRNILNFERDWPEATVIKLEQNYRSTGTIVKAASALIRHNLQRTDKTLWTADADGDPISLYAAYDEVDEARFIARELTRLHRTHPWRTMAVLYRTNAQSRVIESACLDASIPYRIVGGVRFYERKEVKDALAILRVLANPRDLAAIERMTKALTLGIGPKALELLRTLSLPEARAAHPKIDQLFRQVDQLVAFNQPPAELVITAARRFGLATQLLDGSEEGESRWENVEELASVARSYEDLASFLADVALTTDLDQVSEVSDGVLLMTLHNAKGLEFPVVFIAGCEEGVFPHSRSLGEAAELEEERRLAYVGVTRARELLYLTRADSRLLYGEFRANIPSRFLQEIPEEYRTDI